MITETLKAKWAAGEATINGWCSIGSPFSAEIMAAQGYDSVSVDLQHGALDYSHALPMIQAMRASGVVPMARVPWLEPGVIMKMLDGGAYGIICPMVNNAEEAARFVSYLRYPPLGQRSFGPTRVSFAAGSGYYDGANAGILAFAMIETADGMKNLDAIAATPGLDGLYVGPADLTIGVTGGRLPPGFDREEPEMIEALQAIAAAAKKAGIASALHCGTPEYAARAASWGFNMLTVSSDVRLMVAGATGQIKTFRSLTAAGRKDAVTGGGTGGY